MEGDTWVDRFLSKPSSLYFVRVPREFLAQFLDSPRFPDQVAEFTLSRALILDIPIEERIDITDIQPQAEVLYGVIHAEFLKGPPGCDLILQKSKARVYGHCPRLFCQKTLCIPCGQPGPKVDTVKRFCPVCRQIYKLDNQIAIGTDGAYFGMEYIDVFVSLHPEVLVVEPREEYVPRIYGFRISRTAVELDEPEPPPE
jgi:casein kinase II subunit beta